MREEEKGTGPTQVRESEGRRERENEEEALISLYNLVCIINFSLYLLFLLLNKTKMRLFFPQMIDHKKAKQTLIKVRVKLSFFSLVFLLNHVKTTNGINYIWYVIKTITICNTHATQTHKQTTQHKNTTPPPPPPPHYRQRNKARQGK